MWSNSFALSTVTSKLSLSIYLFPSPAPSKLGGVWFYGFKDIRVNRIYGPKCIPNKKKIFPLQGNVEIGFAAKVLEVKSSDDEINKLVNKIKSMLCSMEDGEEITVSAYDTAWVALVKDINGNPQFPSSLEWIANNQLPDGSWGDKLIFEAHDRLLSTLACVIALKTWNLHPEKYEKGLCFFKENIWKLEEANAEHMVCGFELVFPALLQMARRLDIEIPADFPILQKIYALRDLKLSKVLENTIMNKVPTTLLYSLEGMEGLNWEALLKLKSHNGSMLSSPSSTAHVLMQTKDPNCLAFLERTVQKFKGGVPQFYPLELYARIWVVDRLQRLGISGYFQPEIDDCIGYIYRYWRDEGICWMADGDIVDLDDTCMAFRLLRLHGYQVSSEVLENCKEDGEFRCFRGQLNEGVTTIMNLYRASQLLFPGETILEDAKKFSYRFLREKQAFNQLEDKWVISKDLPGEVEYQMEVPWYASLPRVEARVYIEQYGVDDVWIAKTLYRLPKVQNSEYLQLAKLDYNHCQALHLAEWNKFRKWCEECKLGNFGISIRSGLVLFAYFKAAASIFEPERSKQRLAWAMTSILLDTMDAHFDDNNNSIEHRKAFVREFSCSSSISAQDKAGNARMSELVKIVTGTLHCLSEQLITNGQDILLSLHLAWEKWLQTWEETGDRHQGEAQLLVQIINLTGGHWASDEELIRTHHHPPQYEVLSLITNRVCWQLGHYQKHKVNDCGTYNNSSCCKITTPEIEADMQRLVQLVLENTEDGMNTKIKETFLVVARSYYYAAYCDTETINNHINKVLFEKIM